MCTQSLTEFLKSLMLNLNHRTPFDFCADYPGYLSKALLLSMIEVRSHYGVSATKNLCWWYYHGYHHESLKLQYNPDGDLDLFCRWRRCQWEDRDAWCILSIATHFLTMPVKASVNNNSKHCNCMFFFRKYKISLCHSLIMKTIKNWHQWWLHCASLSQAPVFLIALKYHNRLSSQVFISILISLCFI